MLLGQLMSFSGNKNAAHMFCPNDGSSLFADLGSVGGKDVLAVNVYHLSLLIDACCNWLG